MVSTAAASVRAVGPGPTILAVLAAVVPAVGGFALLAATRSAGEYLKTHHDPGIYLYALGFALTAGLALLPTWVQALVGGYAFGLPLGLAAALFGFGAGAMIGYEIARFASGDRVVKAVDAKPKWRAVHEAFASGRVGGGFFRTLGIVILLRLPPNSPFAMMNLVMAGVQVPRVPYLLGTIIGMAPRTAMWIWIGSTLPVLGDKRPAQPMWMWAGSLVLLFAVIWMLNVLANRAIDRATGVSAASGATPPVVPADRAGSSSAPGLSNQS
jgi:uncharacterized membrane protein YdjX (TVP38/TMEM64 family)